MNFRNLQKIGITVCLMTKKPVLCCNYDERKTYKIGLDNLASLSFFEANNANFTELNF